MGKQCQTLFFGAPKSLQVVTAAVKLKDAYSLEGKINRWGRGMETVTDFIFLGSKITVDSDCSHKVKRCSLKEKL